MTYKAKCQTYASHLTVSMPEEMGWNRLFHPQLKKRLSFVYRPRLIFLWALGTLVISGSKVLEYYDDFAAGRATAPKSRGSSVDKTE